MLVANRDTRVRIDQWESTMGGADAVTEGRKRKKGWAFGERESLGRQRPFSPNGVFSFFVRRHFGNVFKNKILLAIFFSVSNVSVHVFLVRKIEPN